MILFNFFFFFLEKLWNLYLKKKKKEKLTHEANDSSILEISSKYLYSQTIRAGELKFWKKIQLPPLVISHVSHVTCHVSGVRCNFFFYKVLKLVGGGSFINKAYPVWFCNWSPFFYQVYKLVQQVSQYTLINLEKKAGFVLSWRVLLTFNKFCLLECINRLRTHTLRWHWVPPCHLQVLDTPLGAMNPHMTVYPLYVTVRAMKPNITVYSRPP